MPTFPTYAYTIVTEKGSTNYRTKEPVGDFNSIEDWARASISHLIKAEKPGGPELKIRNYMKALTAAGKDPVTGFE
ncbi:MAG: hypothetical protein IPI66_14295 [Chitinophagaceae bacterium]|nr:hypothetical protein [Chitinophagaceae bacterium]